MQEQGQEQLQKSNNHHQCQQQKQEEQTQGWEREQHKGSFRAAAPAGLYTSSSVKEVTSGAAPAAAKAGPGEMEEIEQGQTLETVAAQPSATFQHGAGQAVRHQEQQQHP